MGSRLKRVAAGSVSERYQTRFCSQFSKNFIENVKFFSTLFVKYLIFKMLQAKSLEVE